MSFAGFVFDMIRHNTTAEDMEKITRLTRQKECSEQKHTVRMMLIVMGVCIIIASVLVFIFTR